MLRRLLVDLPRQIAEKPVVNDLLIKLRILPAPALSRIVHKKFALRNARRAKRIRLHNVRPCFQKSPMNIANQLRPRQRKQVPVVQQILLRILEPLPANIRFLHSIVADRRPRRSINDGDPALDHALQWMFRALQSFLPTIYSSF